MRFRVPDSQGGVGLRVSGSQGSQGQEGPGRFRKGSQEGGGSEELSRRFCREMFESVDHARAVKRWQQLTKLGVDCPLLALSECFRGRGTTRAEDA